MHDLEIVLDERLPADRVVVGGLDRRDAVAAGAPLEVAERGAFVALDHVGLEDDDHVTDTERAALVAELVEAGHGDRILLSSNAIGVAKGQPGHDAAVQPRPDHVRPGAQGRGRQRRGRRSASSSTTRATCCSSLKEVN